MLPGWLPHSGGRGACRNRHAELVPSLPVGSPWLWPSYWAIGSHRRGQGWSDGKMSSALPGDHPPRKHEARGVREAQLLLPPLLPPRLGGSPAARLAFPAVWPAG